MNLILVNPNNPPPDIIFECNDFRRDTGLLLLKRKSDENKFELHLYNDYTNQAIVLTMAWRNDAREYAHAIKQRGLTLVIDI